MTLFLVGLLFALLLALILYAGIRLLSVMLREARGSDIIAEPARLQRLPQKLEGLRILYLSDLHRRELTPDIEGRVKAMGGADIVLIGGDIREKGVPSQRIRDNMTLLGRIAPVYAVYGNHDHDEDIGELDVLLRECGVTVLVNRCLYVRAGNRPAFKLAGVDDPRLLKDNLQEALTSPLLDHSMGDMQAMPFTILLAHDPIIAVRNRYLGADLVLAGHTHGGQIILPLLGPALRTASVRKFPSGWFTLAGASESGQNKSGPTKVRMLVSRGYGTSKAPIRWNCPPVIHLLTLTRDSRD